MSKTILNAGSRSGDVGIVLTSCMSMAGMMQWGMRQSAMLENTMTSVRVDRLYSIKDTTGLELVDATNNSARVGIYQYLSVPVIGCKD
jgi:hypothetical protein